MISHLAFVAKYWWRQRLENEGAGLATVGCLETRVVTHEDAFYSFVYLVYV